MRTQKTRPMKNRRPEPTPARLGSLPLPVRKELGKNKLSSPATPCLTGEGAGGRSSSRSERRLVIALIAFTLFAASLPYLLGYFITPPGTSFVGTVYNIDDYCNYLSWLRQMADGHFFLRNLFTTDPQKGIEFNVFFWLLGRVMAITHCSPQAVLQLARVGGSLPLLWLIYRFYRHSLPANAPARLTAFGLACLSSGFGWADWQRWQDSSPVGSPVDAWQPEAYTFLSLYTSALFVVSTLLILGALYALLLGEQTGKWKYPIIAGVCGGILGNMHSYDVLHISAAWGLFLIVLTVLKRGQGVAMSWLRGIVALSLTLPTTGYMVYLLKHEQVFAKRAAVPTLSPALWHYVLGYGLVFLLAVLAGVVIARRGEPTPARSSPPLLVRKGLGKNKHSSPAPPSLTGEGVGGRGSAWASPLLFALCWAIAGLGVCYLPFAFQRKMLMGEHIPLCLLAGIGAAWLVDRLAPRFRVAALTLIVLASLPSNVLFLARDLRHLGENRSETRLSPFISSSLVDVYDWFRDHTPPEAGIVGFPGLCTYLPGEAGRAVWAGHWGETPHYPEKETEFEDAFDKDAPDAARHAFLQSTGAGYIFYPKDVSPLTYTRHGEVHQYVELVAAPPAYLIPVYSNDTFTVYKIR